MSPAVDTLSASVATASTMGCVLASVFSSMSTPTLLTLSSHRALISATRSALKARALVSDSSIAFSRSFWIVELITCRLHDILKYPIAYLFCCNAIAFVRCMQFNVIELKWAKVRVSHSA
jgi:hypothetical protein